MKVLDLDRITKKLTSNKVYQYLFFGGVFAILFLAMMYFYPMREGHDLQSHYGRILALWQALQDGSFPVYFDQSMLMGYGFATRYFYGDLVLLPAAWLTPCIGVIAAYQVLIILYSLLCALLTYISTNKVFNNRYIAFICTILYTFSYYRLYDVYNRAAVGETICLTFFPLVLWGAYEIVSGNYKKWYILSIAFSMMIFAHVNTPAIVAFTLAIILAFKYKAFVKEPKRLYYLVLAAGVTVVITAYFLFPLFEQLLSNEFYFNTSDISKRLTSNVMFGEPMKYVLRGLFSGATYVVPEIAGIGIVLTMLLCTRIFVFKDAEVKRADFFILIGLLCLFIISPFYPWRVFPFNIIGFIQFSWRFYSVATFIFCVAASIYFYKALKTDKRRYCVGIPFLAVMTLVVIANSGQVYSNNFKETEVIEPSYENEYWLYGGDYIPSKAPNTKDFFRERGNDSIYKINASTKLENYKRELRTLEFDITEYRTRKFAEIAELPLVYYKGYKAELMPLNGMAKVPEIIEVEQSPNGLVMIPIDKTGHVKVYFGGTIIQNVSPYISLISYILLICYIIWFNRKQKNDTKTRKVI